MLGLVFLLTSFVYSANWAVLVAGSYTYSNYRHQSDIFRTYQILKKNGFDTNKIIVMAYDDIARNIANPFPGKVFNYPDGPDVYIGSENIDYKGKDVTADNFIKVITGDKESAKGKVLESTSEDNVFIFFNDHGSSGLICFPVGSYLYANDLYNALNTMKSKNMYKKLLFYVEACYSGSLFENILPSNLSIYAMTAANSHETSWGEYCEDRRYRTCLSNEFSQSWMKFSDINDITKLTVEDEFDHTKTATTKSHVQEFGDFSLKSEFLSVFQAGERTLNSLPLTEFIRPPVSGHNPNWKSVSQTSAHLSYLSQLAKEDEFGEAAIQYHATLMDAKKQNERKGKLEAFFAASPSPCNDNFVSLEKMPLYKKAIETYEVICGRMTENNIWTHTNLIYNAIASEQLNEKNFSQFEKFLHTL